SAPSARGARTRAGSVGTNADVFGSLNDVGTMNDAASPLARNLPRHATFAGAICRPGFLARFVSAARDVPVGPWPIWMRPSVAHGDLLHIWTQSANFEIGFESQDAGSSRSRLSHELAPDA